MTGARTVLSPTEETSIANWCIHMSKIGYGGRNWSRHPDLSLKTTLQLGKEQAVISAEKIHQWFSDLDEYVRSQTAEQDILNDTNRLHNADESGFSLCSTGNQVVG